MTINRSELSVAQTEDRFQYYVKLFTEVNRHLSFFQYLFHDTLLRKIKFKSLYY